MTITYSLSQVQEIARIAAITGRITRRESQALSIATLSKLELTCNGNAFTWSCK